MPTKGAEEVLKSQQEIVWKEVSAWLKDWLKEYENAE